MTDKDFTASNGWTISPPDSMEYINICNSNGVLKDYFSTKSIEPLREYFQAERDKELGRWRDPENPDFAVHPAGFREWNILNEKDGVFFHAFEKDAHPESGWEEYVVLHNYLKAHRADCDSTVTLAGTTFRCAEEEGHTGVHCVEDTDSGAIITWADANVV